MMKKILLTMATVSALAVGAPAAAQWGQSGYSNYGGGNVQARVQQLRVQLQAGVRSGAISRREAMPLQEQVRQLGWLERQYSRDGLSGRERGDLMQRINQLSQQIRIAERSRGGRWDRDDRGRDGDWNRGERGDDRYGDRDRGDDRYGDRDRDDDRYGDRDRDDRDGRWDGNRRDDDRYDGVELRVGQRLSGNVGALPYELRSQFRDGNGVYYRYGGGNVYQVDARTNLILRVFPARR